MKILSRREFTVKTVETQVEDGRSVYLVKDFFDETDCVIDTTVTLNGYEVEDPEECARILDFVDAS